MADNVTLNPGTGGASIATDEVGGAHVQIVKTAYGADGVATVLDEKPATQATLAALLATFQAEDSAASSGALGMPMLAMRYAGDTVTTDADGDWTVPKVDEEGRLKVSTKPGSFALVTGNITANAQSVFCDVMRASNVQIMMNTSSLAGHNVTFEGSIDSTNGTDGVWFGIQVVRSNANTIETASGVLAATPAYAWEASVNGLSFIRVRATGHTSGTATWKFQRGSYATEPIPAAQVTGTQTVSISAPTASNVNSAATTNATSVKTSAAVLYSITVSNTGAAAAFLKLYNKASAPTVGTDVPVLTIPIPASSVQNIDFGTTGHRFTTGLAFAITNLAADSDATAVAASQVKVLTAYA